MKKVIISILALILLIATFIGCKPNEIIIEIVGSSMEPTFMNQDQLLFQEITKLSDNDIKYGDIVLINAKDLPYHSGDSNIVKRLIGLPGDFIEIKDGYVYRNEIMVEESYLNNVDTSERKPEYSFLILGDDEFYFLGDNRPVSLDSRTFGPVKKDKLLGKFIKNINS